MAKFSEIITYTDCGNYQVNISLRHLSEGINHHLENNLILEPDFQRGHVWDEPKQIAFVEYLLRRGRSGLIIYFNCPHYAMGERKDFVLVDGLQRITACLNFLNNKIKVFGNYYLEYEDKISSDICLYFNVNELKTRKEVLRWYLELNTGGVLHTDEELNRVRILLDKEV
jgi:hypothetical protein